MLLSAFCALCWQGKVQADERHYTLAVVPQYTPLLIYRNWQPLVTRLAEETGIYLQIKTYPSFRQFLDALRNGEPDFSYLAPYHLVLARRTQDYEPLLRDAAKQLVGLLLVRKDSAINNIHELQGKTIAFPSPNAFAASLYMQAWLRKEVGLDFEALYVGTHDNVYRHVIRGQVDAGSGVNSTLANQPPRLQAHLRVLYEVPGVVAHPLAVHARVPQEDRERLVSAVKKFIEDEEGRGLLEAVQITQPIDADYERDYSSLESIGLE
ncbi:phosphate/phosphite/phosphonate ABC transporter substrate-binding protein [Sulfuriflexus mobilis]|uniref:phosphate/phosphite/phosphonate ABC transporter substrate-binding protein n=1 Tax=Sulfuriflexus mobilis TaxID=1811807 RepID=UPI000F820372|nr:phosphate/phosphite/phosphonate ABC transporter substrate-binding protein [Sulfuriflexus mobilis]